MHKLLATGNWLGLSGPALEKADDRAQILPVRGGNTAELDTKMWAKKRY